MFRKLALVAALCVTVFTQTVFAKPLPEFVFKQVHIAERSSLSVKKHVKEAASAYYKQPEHARALLVEVLDQVHAGKDIAEYEYLWVLYGLLNASYLSGSSEFVPGASKAEYMKLAEQALDFLYPSSSTGYWHYTERGQFQMELHRTAANGLGWYLQKGTPTPAELAKANTVVSEAIDYIRGPQDYYIYDTLVRILLKQEKHEQAYQIVKEVLAEVPDFRDFQDLKSDTGYLSWLAKRTEG